MGIQSQDPNWRCFLVLEPGTSFLSPFLPKSAIVRLILGVRAQYEQIQAGRRFPLTGGISDPSGPE